MWSSNKHRRWNKSSYKGKTHSNGTNCYQHILKTTHDTGGSSFFLNKKGSFARKCVICDEKHEEQFHIPEFATESAEYAGKYYKGLETEQSDVLKSYFKVNVKKEDLAGKLSSSTSK